MAAGILPTATSGLPAFTGGALAAGIPAAVVSGLTAFGAAAAFLASAALSTWALISADRAAVAAACASANASTCALISADLFSISEASDIVAVVIVLVFAGIALIAVL